MFLLLTFIVIILVHFSKGLILYKKKYSKYIDIYYYYIRDLNKNKQVKLYHINREKDYADFWLKTLTSLIQLFLFISWLGDTLSLSASASIA